MYRLRSDGSIKSKTELTLLFSSTSLPKVWTSETLDFLGVDPILESPKPSVNELQTVRNNGIQTDGNGNWVWKWLIVDKFSDQVDENGAVIKTKSELELEHKEKIREDKRNEISKEFEDAVALIKSGYTEDEIKSWDKQENEARAYTADNLSPTPLLDAISASRGKDKATVVGNVILKADAYAVPYGAALGTKQAREDALALIDLNSPDALDQIGAV